MDFIDLKSQYKKIEEDINVRIKKVLDHGQYIMGPEIRELEERLADYVGVKHCVGVSSGTDALLVAMMALGIKAGDEVITTPFTFIATGEMITLLGAIPVFVDIDSRTYNIDSKLIESAITDKTKAIMPVSLYGQCADFDEINAIAQRYNIPVIEDGAQSFGATYKGRKSCGLSTIGCTSFFPSKPLGAYGDGGACFTDDDELAKLMKQIRIHGQDRRYHHPVVGLNGRLDTLQAAVLLAKIEIFPTEVALRDKAALHYSNALGDDFIVPYIKSEYTSVYAQYSILVNNRDTLQEKLRDSGVPTAVHYPVPLNKQPVFMSESLSFPVAEDVASKVMSLPMHPYITIEDQNLVVSSLLQTVG